jgi:hypothetical protein
MITKLHIKNFKSIKDLKLNCSRVNIFIGEQNTGKSNILEALGLLSTINNPTKINAKNSIVDYVRAEDMTNLFYNKIIDNPISVDLLSSLGHDILTINYLQNEFEIICSDIKNNKKLIDVNVDKEIRNIRAPFYSNPQALPIRYYRFKEMKTFPSKEIDFLKPPYGSNLLKIIQTRKEVKEFVLDLFSKYGYKYQGFEDLNKIYFNLQFKGEFVPLPFHLLSDTLIRIIFYYAIIELNQDAAILLEEPESHIFPFYNKFLAEKISLFSNNQFFIATHNPTFLVNLIEKTKDEDLTVFITKYNKSNYQTKLQPLKGKNADKLLEYGNSLFMNLDRIR